MLSPLHRFAHTCLGFVAENVKRHEHQPVAVEKGAGLCMQDLPLFTTTFCRGVHLFCTNWSRLGMVTDPHLAWNLRDTSTFVMTQHGPVSAQDPCVAIVFADLLYLRTGEKIHAKKTAHPEPQKEKLLQEGHKAKAQPTPQRTQKTGTAPKATVRPSYLSK